MKNKIKIAKGMLLTKFGRPSPVFCQWEITHTCNMNCPFCPITKSESPWKPEMDTQQAFEKVDELAKLGVVILNITGGEPLMREDLDKILARAKKRGINTFVACNGWYLKDKVDMLKDAFAVRISLDGIGEAHDKFRIKGSYEKTIEGLKVLLKRQRNVAINSVINSETPDDQIYALCELAKSFGIQISLSASNVSMQMKKGPTKEDVNKSIASLRADDTWFLSTMKKVRKKYGKTIADPKIYNKIIQMGGLDKYGCRAMDIAFGLKPDGSLAMPCGEWPAEFAKGNLIEIWKSEQVNRVRKKVGKYWFCKGCRFKCYVFPSMLLKTRSMLELVMSYKV